MSFLVSADSDLPRDSFAFQFKKSLQNPVQRSFTYIYLYVKLLLWIFSLTFICGGVHADRCACTGRCVAMIFIEHAFQMSSFLSYAYLLYLGGCLHVFSSFSLFRVFNCLFLLFCLLSCLLLLLSLNRLFFFGLPL